MTVLTQDKIVAVIGAGAMGRGIAQVAAMAGHPVKLFDANPDVIKDALTDLANGLGRLVSKGKITEQKKSDTLNAIEAASDLEDLKDSALVIEAIIENLEIKQTLFRQLEEICGPDCILATNTSSISITAIGAALEQPGRLVGMHFFNPAQIMKLVEVVSGQATDAITAETVLETAQNWGKKPVYAKSTPGFIVNRVARPFYGEAWRLLEENVADAASIDAVMTGAAGFRMGPFALMDLIGHDVNYAVTTTVFDAYHQDPKYRPSLMQHELTLAGHLGRKTGRGVFTYGDQAAESSPDYASSAALPDHCILGDNLEASGALAQRIQSSNIPCQDSDNSGYILIGDTHIAQTDGRSASQRSAEEDIPNLILFDLALDYGSASVIALVKADQTSSENLDQAIGLFQALGMKVVICDDSPGLIAMRIVAMLANEAADAVGWSVATAGAVDTAMTMGVNYPIGPLSFAEQVGLPTILNVVKSLAQHYGEDRYRPAPLLKRKIYSGGSFHE